MGNPERSSGDKRKGGEKPAQFGKDSKGCIGLPVRAEKKKKG